MTRLGPGDCTANISNISGFPLSKTCLPILVFPQMTKFHPIKVLVKFGHFGVLWELSRILVKTGKFERHFWRKRRNSPKFSRHLLQSSGSKETPRLSVRGTGTVGTLQTGAVYQPRERPFQQLLVALWLWTRSQTLKSLCFRKEFWQGTRCTGPLRSPGRCSLPGQVNFGRSSPRDMVDESMPQS